jgi:hypothetical protein
MKTAAEEIRESIADIKSARDEMQAMLKQTDERIAELTAMASKLTAPERIRVPENIKFENWNDGFSLISPNGKCILTASKVFGGIPIVQPSEENDRFKVADPLYLEPCEREDLKCGDVVFGTDRTSQMTNFGLIWSYGVVLNHDTIMRWKAGMEVVSEDYCYSNYYKVVR